MKQLIDIVQDPLEIFEEKQNPKIARQTQKKRRLPKPFLAGAVDDQTASVSNQC